VTDPRIDTYLAARPEEHRALLQALRERVAALAPEAVETISYGMPTFKIGSRFVLSFASWKRHCSIYPIGNDVLAAHAAAIDGYERTKGSLHFTKARPLPDALLVDLVRSRVAAIEAGGR
jgi:uncharacterized protein YdhG (YjbR/CyaY superfamily)